jgi:hypothetical protein
MKLKKCPSCRFWWFDRTSHGCTKQYGRVTYPSTKQPYVEQEKITCSDYSSRKGYEYLLQIGETKQSDRLIRDGDDDEIENGKVLKANRKMNICKSKSKKIKVSDIKIENFIINKQKRMIRIEG